MKEKLRNNQGNMKILVAILVILIIVAGTLFVMKMMKENKELETMVGNNENLEGKKEEEKQKPQPKTFAGDDRPIAFMIDNHIDAMPQAGLEQADLVYEIIVEGGETRLMMLMKNKDVEKIGPLRSARHYYLDYALENDAIYVHYGQSPQAKSDIKTLAISDINGINESETSFWRDNSKYAPHNAVSSIKNIKAIIKREDFRTTTNKGNVLNYVAEEVELGDEKQLDVDENTTDVEENKETAKTAKTVTIPYSTYNTVKYTYDEDTKTYKRYSRDKEQKDWNTNKAISVKNIIITKCKNWSIDSYGRQTIDNVKTLDGYYITNGKYIPIKCEKKTRSGKTVYKDLSGKEIEVNDGKTFIQICPIDSKISFK